MPGRGVVRATALPIATGALAAALLACGPGDAPPPPDRAPELSAAVLRSARYASQYVDEGEIQLERGFFEDTARRVVAVMLPEYAVGNLDGDGAPDAAVLIATSTGGSGTFLDLAAVLNRGNQPASDAIAFLGDRVLVDRVRIRDGEVQLDLTMHGPADPMCCPSVEATRRFRLVDGELVEIEPPAGVPD